MPEPLRVSFYTRWSKRCGIRDYSQHLIRALDALPEMESVRVVEAPEAVLESGKEAVMRYFAEARRFRALAQQANAQADLVHIQHQYFFFGGVAPHKNHTRDFLNALNLPAVMTVHEIAEAGAGASVLVKAALRHVNRANFLHPALHALIVHTEQDRGRLLALGVPAERLHVLPVPVPRALPMPNPYEAKHRLNLQGKRVLTIFGFLAKKKGHALALNALKRLPKEYVLLFAGDRHPDDHSDYVSRLKAGVEVLELGDRVRFLGYLAEERVPQVMAATDLALAPFVQTSGSASLSHLFAYGVAVLGSDIAPHREIAEQVEEPLALFPSEDVEACAARIEEIFGEESRLAELRVASRAYAERLSFANMAQRTLEIYGKVF